MSREADITYKPAVRDLSEAMFFEGPKEFLIKILDNRINQLEKEIAQAVACSSLADNK